LHPLPYALALLLVSPLLVAQTASPAASPQGKECSVPAGAILRMELSGPVRVSRLRPGSELDGDLLRPVYVYDRAVIPAGSQIRAVVDKVEKEKAPQKKGFMARLDTVRSLGLNRQKLYEVKLRAASVTLPSGATLPLDLRFIRSGEEVRLQAANQGEIKVGGETGKDLAKRAPGVAKVESIKRGKKQVQQYRHPVATLELEHPVQVELPGQPEAPLATPANQPVTIPEGTHADFLLLTELRASENKQGDSFQARLLEPIFQPDGHLLLPEGSLLQGHISRLLPPRRLSRAASMYLVFDRLSLPGGETEQVSASLAAAAVNKKAALKMDPEGGLHGNGQGVKHLATRLVLSAASQQAADEAVEMAAHAVAPYAGIGTGLFFLLSGHGNDVDLPQYSELQIVFGRPVTVPAATPANQPNPGKPPGEGSPPIPDKK